MNSTALRSLQTLTSDQQFLRNLDFFNFLQLLTDNDHILPLSVDRINNMRQKMESAFSVSIKKMFAAIKAFYEKKQDENIQNADAFTTITLEIEGKLSKINTTSVENLVQDVLAIANEFRLIGSNAKIWRQHEFLQILSKISSVDEFRLSGSNAKFWGQQKKWSLHEKIVEHLNACKKYFNNSQFWYAWAQAQTDPNITCVADKFILKGYIVYMSNVVKLECYQNAKFINIFALLKVYIDVDINKIGKSAELSIISPIWEIDRRIQINMQGEHEMEYQREAQPNDKNGDRDGEDGLSGEPGVGFLGIASFFIKGNLLSIECLSTLGEVKDVVVDAMEKVGNVHIFVEVCFFLTLVF